MKILNEIKKMYNCSSYPAMSLLIFIFIVFILVFGICVGAPAYRVTIGVLVFSSIMSAIIFSVYYWLEMSGGKRIRKAIVEFAILFIPSVLIFLLLGAIRYSIMIKNDEIL